MNKTLIISKLDAAKRQLETVIRIYFSNGDPVSIHTVTAAAYNLIRDINDKKGGDKMLAKDGFIEYLKKGHEKEVRDLINKAENFFKHADRDHEASLEFNPDQSEYLIVEACGVYSQLSGEFPPLFKLYQSWFIVTHQHLANFTDEWKHFLSMGAQEAVSLGREQYFSTALPIFSKINT